MNKMVQIRVEELEGYITIAAAKLSVCTAEMRGLTEKAELLKEQSCYAPPSVIAIRMGVLKDEKQKVTARANELNRKIGLWKVELETLVGMMGTSIGDIEGKPNKEELN